MKGLIDRLNDGPIDKESVFGHAMSMRGAGDTYLLESEEGTLSHIGPDLDGEDDQIVPGAAVRSLMKELQTQRHFGITTPSHLFSLLHRHMALRRGALLVPHRDGDMVPIATAGLDKTSAFRIRILQDELEWLGNGKHAVVLDDSRREILSKRLSRRDAAVTPRIALFPFTHRQDVVAVLVVLESPLLRMDPQILDVIVGALSESGGRLLFDGRVRPFDLQPGSTIFQRSHLPSVLGRLKQQAQQAHREVLVIEVDMQPLVAEFAEAHPHLDRARLFEDILDTTALVTRSAHTTVFLGGNRVALIDIDTDLAAPQLVVHLLTTTLASLFGSTHPRPLTYRLWTAEEVDSEVRDDTDS